MNGRKYKMFCERCQEAVFVDDDAGPCPACGSDELSECEEEEIDAYEFFDSPESPVDTVGGI